MPKIFRAISTLFFILATLVDSSANAALVGWHPQPLAVPVEIDGKLVPIEVEGNNFGFKVRRNDELKKKFFGKVHIELPEVTKGVSRIEEFFMLEGRFFVLLKQRTELPPYHYSLAEVHFKVDDVDTMDVSDFLKIQVMGAAGIFASGGTYFLKGLPSDPAGIIEFSAGLAAVVVAAKVYYDNLNLKWRKVDQKVVLDRLNWIKGGEKRGGPYEIYPKRENGILQDIIVQRSWDPKDTYSLKERLQSCEAKLE